MSPPGTRAKTRAPAQAGFLVRFLWVALVALAAGGGSWLLARRGAVAEQTTRRHVRVAITFDDLPSSTSLPPGYTSERLLSELVSSLQAHDVRNATGFLIGSRLEHDHHALAALAHWTNAGYELGNHSYSHHSPAELGSAGYQLDIVRVEPALRVLEAQTRQAARYFRYPYLLEGRDRDERKLFANTLTQLGYTLARVSMDFQDWRWADAYGRCMERGDEPSLAKLSASYLEQARAQFAWTLDATRAVIGRPVSHVLLLHANVATAQNLDALLTEYERLGAVFVPLTDALADPLYPAEYDGNKGTLLDLVAGTSGLPLPARPAFSQAPLDSACAGAPSGP
jgi:peptidoglycan-N-acetylglucosamine deacetylase